MVSLFVDKFGITTGFSFAVSMLLMRIHRNSRQEPKNHFDRQSALCHECDVICGGRWVNCAGLDEPLCVGITPTAKPSP